MMDASPNDEIWQKDPPRTWYVLGRHAVEEKALFYWCSPSNEIKEGRWFHEDVLNLLVLLGDQFFTLNGDSETLVNVKLQSKPNESETDNLDALEFPKGQSTPTTVSRPAPARVLVQELMRGHGNLEAIRAALGG